MYFYKVIAGITSAQDRDCDDPSEYLEKTDIDVITHTIKVQDFVSINSPLYITMLFEAMDSKDKKMQQQGSLWINNLSIAIFESLQNKEPQIEAISSATNFVRLASKKRLWHLIDPFGGIKFWLVALERLTQSTNEDIQNEASKAFKYITAICEASIELRSKSSSELSRKVEYQVAAHEFFRPPV